jgi:hypothetical protein
LLIVIVSIYKLVVHQIDVKTAFLNGNLEDEIYMKQHEGLVIPSQEHKRFNLKKFMYGLKQTPKQWHEKFDKLVLSNAYLNNSRD